MIQRDSNSREQISKHSKLLSLGFILAQIVKLPKMVMRYFICGKKYVYIIAYNFFLPSSYEFKRFTIEKPIKFSTRKSVLSAIFLMKFYWTKKFRLFDACLLMANILIWLPELVSLSQSGNFFSPNWFNNAIIARPHYSNIKQNHAFCWSTIVFLSQLLLAAAGLKKESLLYCFLSPNEQTEGF